VFDWDQHNLKKVKAHRISAAEVEQALSGSPILVYQQELTGNRAMSITARPPTFG